MGRPAGSVLEATLQGTCCGQTVLNVFHYAVTTVSSITSPIAEQDDFLDAFGSLGAGGFLATFLAITPENYTLQRVTAQFIHPVRYRRSVEIYTSVGLTDVAASANVQASITFQTELSGRAQIGGKRLLINTVDVMDGLLVAGFKTNIETFVAQAILSKTGATGGGVYTPCIYHRSANAVPKFHLITGGFVQDTARVMRRRTVGLGI